MTDSRKDPAKASTPPDVGVVCDVGRRRILRAGISAAPVVMTVASRPVLATTNPPGICESPSGFISANLSRPAGSLCAGRTPGYWKQSQHFGSWKSPYVPTGGSATLFKTWFSPDLPSASLTFLCVLEPQCSGSGPPYDVARHIVAAALNNAAGFVPQSILPLATIQAMWTAYNNGNGCYPVTPSICWNGAQIVDYLLSTMD